MNAVDIILALIIAAALVFAVIKMISGRKKGCCGCDRCCGKEDKKCSAPSKK